MDMQATGSNIIHDSSMGGELLSPSGQNLDVVLFVAKEGLSSTYCNIYEGVMLYSEWVASFGVEQNSDVIDEQYKNQRDVDEPRVGRMEKYFTRADTSLPSITIFITSLDLIESFQVGNRSMVRARIHHDVGRLVSDGQGRTECINRLLPNRPDLSDHTIAFKLLVTNTQTIWEARHVIRQHFSDFNSTSSKPNPSISLLFDQSKPFGQLMAGLLSTKIAANDNRPLVELVAIHGKIRKGKLWTYMQFFTLVKSFFGATGKMLNESLDTPELATTLKHQAIDFLVHALNALPLHILHEDSWKENHQNALFTKALFAKGLGKTAKSLLDDHLTRVLRGQIEDDAPIDWTPLEGLISMPILDMSDPLWLKMNVCHKDGKGKVKIIKDTDEVIARVICHRLDIKPSLEI